MNLHPLIHAELIRQQQHELARRTLHAPLSTDVTSRSRPGREVAARIATLIVAALATLALTVPGAYAASGKKHPHGKPGSGAVAAGVNHGKGNGKGKGIGDVRVVAPIIYYVYWTVPAIQPATSSPNPDDDCVNYQLNCTREQNCQFWGFDCEPTSVATDTQATSQDSSASDASSPAEADSRAADATATSDAVASQPTTDSAANLGDPSQNDDQDC